MTTAAFFDLDRTLIDCNSGRLWLMLEWREGRVNLPDAAWAAYWLGRYSLGLETGLEAVFENIVGRLAGTAERDLEARVDRWFAAEVAPRLRPGARAALARHREAGDRLVLATTSSPYAARAARKTFGLDDQVSTTFEVVDGLFTGKVAAWALGHHKADRVREYAVAHDIELRSAAFYTDSVSDLRLLEEVGRPVAVNPDRALRAEAVRRGWPVVDWGSGPGEEAREGPLART